jgi:alkylhydroperoxidase family enzyme
MREAIAALLPPEPRHPIPRQDDGRPKGRNVLGTLAHHPALTRAFHTFNGHVQFASTLSTRQRELIVLRVAHRRHAEYEWVQHVIQGRDAGLTDDEILRVREGAEAPGWTPLEAAMLQAVDELVADAVVSDDTWGALAAELDVQQLLDLVFTVGAYEVLAMAIKSCGVQLDEDLIPFRHEPRPD